MPRAVVVRGEAGVGKTRLVGAVCGRASERDLTVLWGTCVRFGAIESTFLPWVMAVERWLASAAEPDRQRVLGEVPDAAQLLPSMGGGSGRDPVRLMRVLTALVTSIGARRPTVLVMDDVQWADPASRDVLTYLLAGLSQERLLVLATVRDEGVPAEDPVHSWLADLRRLPSVTELPLARLRLDETAEQVGSLLGQAPASVAGPGCACPHRGEPVPGRAALSRRQRWRPIPARRPAGRPRPGSPQRLVPAVGAGPRGHADPRGRGTTCPADRSGGGLRRDC